MKTILEFGPDETEEAHRAIMADTLCSILFNLDNEIRSILKYSEDEFYTLNKVEPFLERLRDMIQEARLDDIYT